MKEKLKQSLRMLMDDINKCYPSTYFLIGAFSTLIGHFLLYNFCYVSFHSRVDWFSSLLFGIVLSVIVSLYSSFFRENNKFSFHFNEMIWTLCGNIITLLIIVLIELHK
ncbi:MAG: hypothetical protein FWF52_00095 [Candidatus Azobacteroides sp.]|nr:hypothetical protein [Candidatus Azobacteroides sp.]